VPRSLRRTQPAPRRSRAIAPLLVLALALALPRPAAAQQTPEQRARAQRAELERIRRERAALEARAAELQTSMHDLSEEVTNLDRRAETTERLVRALDAQIATINDEVAEASTHLVHAEDELVAKRAALHKRLADIYKRGPMYTVEALLSAQSFGELVARYKYLHLLALHDRALVHRVQQLRDQVARDRNRLVALQQAIEDNRSDKAEEEERLRSLQRERESRLALVKRSAVQTAERLERLRRTEAQLSNAIAALEASRRRAEARPNAVRGSSSIRTTDYGRLDWPVNGPLLYDFGKASAANNTTIRWNGVGIRAPMNTPVHAVAAGRVVSVRPLGTYGLTIIIDHGGGDYSVYGSLGDASVREGQMVDKGDPIGTVGISDPELPAHLHFEIRHGGPAVDPATWLRERR
jgi:septal ring factor EnvC (AmiA/AmiB activator)